jgi:hypothetical protein
MDWGKGCIIYLIISAILCGLIWGVPWVSSCIGEGYDNIRCSKLTSDYKEALKNQDFEKAHEVLTEIYTYYDDVVDDNREEKWMEIGWSTNEKNIMAASSIVCDAIKSIYSEEIRLLVSFNSEDSWERIIYLLGEMNSIGRKYNNNTKLSKYSVDPYLAASYQEFVEAKNFICNLCLNLAIDKGNMLAGKKILRYYLSNCRIDQDKHSSDRIISYIDSDIKEAKKKYKEAFSDNLNLSPEKTNISGPLNLYFEVVNREYVISESANGHNTITIEFKRRNKKGNYSEKTIRLRFMDKNKNIVCSANHTIYDDSPLYYLKVGETGSVQFHVDDNDDITSFVVESSN